MMGRIALLLGLFAAPAFLLWAGHHWRHKSARIRGAFWGGLLAHTLAALIATVAGLYRPAEWAASDLWRGFFGLWSMLVFFAIGAAIGAMRSSRDDAPRSGAGRSRPRAAAPATGAERTTTEA
jgi:hypothetical protein